MASKFNKNGYGGGDFKRNTAAATATGDANQDGEDASQVNEKAQEYIRELLAEKHKAEQASLTNSVRLLDLELTKAQSLGRSYKDTKYVDIYRDKPVNIRVKVLVPIKEHPKFNFVGNLLGPKGTTVKALQEETLCKMAIFGKGSMRDRNEEEKLRLSLEPKFAHLSDELHVEISALAPPAEAYARMAFALAEVRKYLIPELNPDQQFQEGGPVPRGHGPPLRGPPPRGPPRGHPAQAPPPPPPYRQAPRYDDQYDAPPSQEDYGSYYDAPPAPAQQRDYYRETPNAITTEHDPYYSREGYGGAVTSNRPFKQGGRGGAGNQQQGNAAQGRRGPGGGAGRERVGGGAPFRNNPYSRPKQ